MTIGGVVGRGGGEELLHEVVHLGLREHLTNRDGGSTRQREGHLPEELLDGERATVGDSRQELDQQALDVNAVQAGRVTYDGDGTATEVVDIET